LHLFEEQIVYSFPTMQRGIERQTDNTTGPASVIALAILQ